MYVEKKVFLQFRHCKGVWHLKIIHFVVELTQIYINLDLTIFYMIPLFHPKIAFKIPFKPLFLLEVFLNYV